MWTFVSFQERALDITVRQRYILTSAKVNAASAVPLRCVYEFKTKLLPPAILHPTREAGCEGLKYYQLTFGSTKKLRTTTVTIPPRIYANFTADLVCWMKCYEIADWGGLRYLLTHPVMRLALGCYDDEAMSLKKIKMNGPGPGLNAVQQICLFYPSEMELGRINLRDLDMLKFSQRHKRECREVHRKFCDTWALERCRASPEMVEELRASKKFYHYHGQLPQET